MSTLHLINKSPLGNPALGECLKVCNTDDAILLLEDGVYAALNTQEISNEFTVYAVKDDCFARGLIPEKLNPAAQLIDYNRFVDLSCEFKNCLNWS